jgi:hypothetical protein
MSLIFRSCSSCCLWICYGYTSLSLSCNSHCTGLCHKLCLYSYIHLFDNAFHYLYSQLLRTKFFFQIILLLGYGPDAPPTKVFRIKSSSASKTDVSDNDKSSSSRDVQQFLWKPVFHFILWMLFWTFYVLLLSSIVLNKVGGLQEMFEK